MSDPRRVVVTGVGLVSPLGIGTEETWRAAVAGRSGAGPITHFDASEHHCRIACEVAGFVPEDHMDRKSARRMDRVSQLAVAAGRLALIDAGLDVEGERERVGAVIATGAGGNQTFEEQHRLFLERGPDRVSPLAVATIIVNMSAGWVSMALGLGGPISCPVTACASGTHGVGDAAELIRTGAAQVMLAGGSEAGITPFTMAALDATRALSRRNEDPVAASRPFDVGRDGFVAGEAGAVLVLEELEHALARGAEPICEVRGYGMSGDAHHVTEPDPSGRGQVQAMRAALRDGGLEPGEIDYVNAHGTSTPAGDPVEIGALRQLVGDERAREVMVSSTKSMHGHAMGAAGGLEAALAALAIRDGVVPPTINLDDMDPACAGVDHVANAARRAPVRVALSNSFGFGGHNAVIALAAL
ncbi:MAG: 3-oxoacyl-[acyl-carrier-protein] synthase [Miltoncostaeaceae bacterium]|jgi:3-oxoacyl-[acyl-carrier-protein] synthase II|nr:3-oxoacyl-[acyl-carrier-protein] synthase [Miltoncostaeaceae bacterium]